MLRGEEGRQLRGSGLFQYKAAEAAVSALKNAERAATATSIAIAKCCQRCNAGESGILIPLRNGIDGGDDAQVFHGVTPSLGK